VQPETAVAQLVVAEVELDGALPEVDGVCRETGSHIGHHDLVNDPLVVVDVRCRELANQPDVNLFAVIFLHHQDLPQSGMGHLRKKGCRGDRWAEASC
jgi:hypothetical protein